MAKAAVVKLTDYYQQGYDLALARGKPAAEPPGATSADGQATERRSPQSGGQPEEKRSRTCAIELHEGVDDVAIPKVIRGSSRAIWHDRGGAAYRGGTSTR